MPSCIQCPQFISNWFPSRANAFEPTLGTPASSARQHRAVVFTQPESDMRSVSSISSSEKTPNIGSIPIPTRKARPYSADQASSPSPGEIERLEDEGERRTWNMFHRIMDYRAKHPPLRVAAMSTTNGNFYQNQPIYVTMENPHREMNIAMPEDSMDKDMIFKMSV